MVNIKNYSLLFCMNMVMFLSFCNAEKNREQSLINHVLKSIASANVQKSCLTESVLILEGYSSRKVRHLLNN